MVGDEVSVESGLNDACKVIFASPAEGYSTGQAMQAVTEVADSVLPRDMSYAWNGISYQ